jgi:hypothetical protein
MPAAQKRCTIAPRRPFNSEMRAAVCVFACGCNAVAASVVAPGPPPPPTAIEPQVFAIPDETMEFHVALRGMTVGTVQTAVGKPGWVDGKRAVIVKSRGKTEGLVALIGDLQWELTTTIDLDRSMPIDDHEEAWVEFAGEKHHENDTHAWDADDHHHDVHSAAGLLRGWRAELGQHAHPRVEVAGGRFALDIWPAAHETANGKPAVRYDGIAADKFHFAMWISDDLARVPLQFRTESKLGTIEITLVDYQVPRD